MPTSVIDIPVNSQQFDAFIAKFNAYRNALKEMPAVWAEAGDAAASVAVGFAAMTAALLEQNDLFHKQDQLAKEQAKAAKKAADDKKAADKAQEDRDKAAATRRKQAVDDAKRLAGYVKDTVVDLAKWTALGGLGSLVTGALGLWGLDQFVGSIANERRLAQGLGVTTGERQALSINMQRYFDVNSALQNVQTGQLDLTSPQRVAMTVLGVNPDRGDPAQVLAQVALKARARFIADHENLAVADAEGLTKLFSPEDLVRMAKQRPGDIEASARQAQKDAAPGGRLFLSDEVGRKWQNFLANLDTAGTALQNKLVDKLTVLERPLEGVIDKFGNLLLTVLDRVDFKVLGDGLDRFSQYIGSTKFQTDFKTFMDDTAYAAGKMVDVLRMLGLIPDAKPTMDQQTAARIAGDNSQIAAAQADMKKKQEMLANAGNPLYFGAGLFPDRKKLAAQIAADAKSIADTRADIASVQNLSGAAVAAGGVSTPPAWAHGTGAVQFAGSPLGSPYTNAQAFFDKLFGHHTIITGGSRSYAQDIAMGIPAAMARRDEHVSGDAWDLKVPGMTNAQVIAAVIKSGLRFNELFDEQNHVHVGFRGSAGKLGTGFFDKVHITGHQTFSDGTRSVQPHVRVSISNQTGASVATTVNALQ